MLPIAMISRRYGSEGPDLDNSSGWLLLRCLICQAWGTVEPMGIKSGEFQTAPPDTFQI